MDIQNQENIFKSNLLVEQHFHGAFGVDFSTCNADDILVLAKKMLEHGIGGIFPTLVTDSVENIKRQIGQIKIAKSKQTIDMAEILGIHLEGIFINPEKKGIHDENLFLKPTVENYKLIEDDFIKIVTLAPELDENSQLQIYLESKGVKVQAGHCIGGDLSHCNGATHLFNAMGGVTHRNTQTALAALINDEITAEVIADGIHLSDDILDLVFKTKPKDKVILVSDSLPFAGVILPSSSEEDERFQQEGRVQKNLDDESVLTMIFAGSKIYYDGQRATSVEGTIAGSTAVLDGIVKRLSLINPDKFEKFVNMASENVAMYHNVHLNGSVSWDKDFNIVSVEKDGFVINK